MPDKAKDNHVQRVLPPEKETLKILVPRYKGPKLRFRALLTDTKRERCVLYVRL